MEHIRYWAVRVLSEVSRSLDQFICRVWFIDLPCSLFSESVPGGLGTFVIVTLKFVPINAYFKLLPWTQQEPNHRLSLLPLWPVIHDRPQFRRLLRLHPRRHVHWPPLPRNRCPAVMKTLFVIRPSTPRQWSQLVGYPPTESQTDDQKYSLAWV